MSATTLTLPAGPVAVRDTGSGPTLLFVHGLLVDSTLWDPAVALLSDRYRCIQPDLPLGSHRTPMNAGADLSPRGVANLIADLIAAMDLEDVTVAANDTGGAITQLLITERPDRITRVVLTPCDAFDNFLPPMFKPLQILARIPGGVNAMLQPLRLRALRRLPMAYGALTVAPLPKATTDRWLAPAFAQRAVRRDVTKLLRAIDTADTLAAAEKLRTYDKPVLFVWSKAEKSFLFKHAEELAAIIPDARVIAVDDAKAFLPLDQPQVLAAAIAEFVPQAVAAGAHSAG